MQPWSAASLMKDYLATVPGYFITAVTPGGINVALKIVSVAGHWGIMYNILAIHFFSLLVLAPGDR